MAYHVRHIPLKGAIGGGVLVAFIGIGIGIGVGMVGASRAASLLETSLPTIRFMASAVMTAAATTLALLLTLLGVTAGNDQQLDKSFYRSVRTVARLTVWAFVGSVVLLASLVIPFSEDLDIPRRWYIGLYYAFTVGSALCAGFLVTVVMVIFSIIKHLIGSFWLVDHDEVEDAPADTDAEARAQPEADGQERDGKARATTSAES